MRFPKSQIALSDFHPSRLLDLKAELVHPSPIIVNQDGILVDGYCRYLAIEGEFVEVFEIKTENLFDAAFQYNRYTRKWDEIDCFLWTRWARYLDYKIENLPFRKFPLTILDAPDSLIRDLANRKLLLRQLQLILEHPSQFRQFFHTLLTEKIQLNANETKSLLDLCGDLLRNSGSRDIHELFSRDSIKTMLGARETTPKQKGEQLLKHLRALRYPYYQSKLDQFSSNWQRLNLSDDIEVNSARFNERGTLEVHFKSDSKEELIRKVTKLHGSLNSPVWDDIWEE